MCADRVRCSSNTSLDIWFVFWVLSFGHLFKSSYFLLFAFFLVEKLLFLFYPHSSEILFAQSQCKISFKSWFKYLFICFRELLEYRRLVSSAKWCITECWITLLRSLIHIQNSSRPKTEPCSTLWVLINAVDSLPFIYVYCFLLVKYNLISLKGVSDTVVVELRQEYVMIYCIKSFLKVKKNSTHIVVVVKYMSDFLSFSY